MSHWPPSPFVEDETVSLSKELFTEFDQTSVIPCQGSVDQQPIIEELVTPVKDISHPKSIPTRHVGARTEKTNPLAHLAESPLAPPTSDTDDHTKTNAHARRFVNTTNELVTHDECDTYVTRDASTNKSYMNHPSARAFQDSQNSTASYIHVDERSTRASPNHSLTEQREVQYVDRRQRPRGRSRSRSRARDCNDKQTSGPARRDQPTRRAESRQRSEWDQDDVKGGYCSSSLDETLGTDYNFTTHQANTRRRRSSRKLTRPYIDRIIGDAHKDRLATEDKRMSREINYVHDGKVQTLSSSQTIQIDTKGNRLQKAFEENARKPVKTYYMTDDTAVSSRSGSPVRTLTNNKRQSIYGRKNSTSLPRPLPYARNHSYGGMHVRDHDIYHSSLPQSTISGSPTSSQASSRTDTRPYNRLNGVQSKPVSRNTSPVRSMLSSSLRTQACKEDNVKAVDRYSRVATSRPSTRDGPEMKTPYRAATWQNHDRECKARRYHRDTSDSRAAEYSSPKNPRLPPPVFRSHSDDHSPISSQYHNSEVKLPKCPRACPSTQHQDWITISGMPLIDICPTCIQPIARISRYYPLLHCSYRKPYDCSTVCSMSQPWIREAFIQCIRQDKPDLGLLQDILEDGSPSNQCRQGEIQEDRWWDFYDPYTDRTIANFSACSACMHKIQALFPWVQQQFGQRRGFESRRCCLHPYTSQWSEIIDSLEFANTKCRQRSRFEARSLESFADQIRFASRFQVCQGERMVANKLWHIHPDIPDLTICEVCFDEVVLPERNCGLAHGISLTTKIVPNSILQAGTASTPPVMKSMSCQLYSKRMRKLFRKAIDGEISVEKFGQMVRARVEMQNRLAEQNKSYELDEKHGVNRTLALEENKRIWRQQFE